MADARGPNTRPTPTDRGSDRINFSWLVRLRWGAVAGQICTIAVVATAMKVALPLLPLLALVGVEAITNVLCVLRLRSARPISAALVAAVTAFDVLVLTGLLMFSGGAYNPFSFLYLVNIALAAVVLQPRWTWALLVLAAVCSGLVFSGVAFAPGGGDDAMVTAHAHHLETHLQGMWIAFLVAAGFIVYFVLRVRRSLAERESDLAAERATATRNERLTSLATLAAGAAHELATPLATIGMVAKELDRHIRNHLPDPQAIEDVGLIRAQVERCRAILDQMSVDAGAPRADASRQLAVADLFEAALGDLGARDRVSVDLPASAEGFVFEGPLRALAQALRGTIKNALEASGEAARVELRASADSGTQQVRIEVVDRGSGMSADTLARAGEPFFTTKEPGKGMGLGLFLTRTVFERLGGGMRLESRAGDGTRVILTLPARPATIRRMVSDAPAG
jgi:two-component system sensor histidine kinase RegB